MNIKLEGLGKRYRYEWVFQELTFEFNKGKHYAIRGRNGSGKSTLLKCLSGFLTPSKGSVSYSDHTGNINREHVYKQVTFTSPYTQLIEELSLNETLKFHQQFKPFQKGKGVDDVLRLLDFSKSSLDKEIRFFSSGMQQRLKLILGILSESPIVLLDEPTITLDRQGIEWYLKLIAEFITKDQLLIIASNVEEDLSLCDASINIEDYKND